MNLTKNADGSYTCDECKFIFGEGMMKDMGNDFNGYHTSLHSMVIKNLEDNFKDISQGEQ